MNTNLQTLYPYQDGESWVFDDPETGLVKEEFVRGADLLLERIVVDIVEPENGFELVFSDEPFEAATEHLTWIRSEDNGNWYMHVGMGLEAWLCPSLHLYFDSIPPDLYLALKTHPRHYGRI